MDLGRPEEAERVLLAGTNIMQKGPKDCRDEILADPCPIPNGAAGLQLLGEACFSFVSQLCHDEGGHADTMVCVDRVSHAS